MLVKSVEKKEDSSVVFQVECDKEEFEAAVASAYKKNKGQIYIPGFRKGKAPRSVIEGMYGAEVFYQDALDILAPDAFEFGTKESELKVVGAPAIKDANITEEKTVDFTFTADIYPEVTLGDYKGLEVERASVEVKDEEVQSELESVQRRNGRKISVERAAQMGDTANIDFDGYLDGERFEGGRADNYFLELGSNSFVPGFEEQIVGMSAGEEKDINITFPEDYVENLAGKDVVFKVKLNGLTYTELPVLDDEFAKDNGFDTLDEYKANLKKDLEEKHKEQNENAVRSALMQKAVDNMTVVVPSSMVSAKEEEIVRNYAANFGMADNNMPFEQLCGMMGLDKATLDSSILPTATYQVKSELLLDAIAKAENFEISEEDLEAYVARISENMGATPDQLKSYFGEEFIKAELKKEKAANVLYDNAVIKDAKPAKKKATKKAAKPAEDEAGKVDASEAEAEKVDTEDKPKTTKKRTAKKAEEKAEEEPAKEE